MEYIFHFYTNTIMVFFTSKEHSLKIRRRKKWSLVQSLWETDLFHLHLCLWCPGPPHWVYQQDLNSFVNAFTWSFCCAQPTLRCVGSAPDLECTWECGAGVWRRLNSPMGQILCIYKQRKQLYPLMLSEERPPDSMAVVEKQDREEIVTTQQKAKCWKANS